VETITILLSIIAFTTSGVSIFILIKLSNRIDDAFGGKSTDSLESKLSNHFSRMRQIDSSLKIIDSKLNNLAALNSMASQKISIVRFNPFGDTGGDQSFCLAVLDGHNSGYVITSIHGRQGTRSYIKPIDLGTSRYGLSAEEKQAISQAIKRTPEIIND